MTFIEWLIGTLIGIAIALPIIWISFWYFVERPQATIIDIYIKRK